MQNETRDKLIELLSQYFNIGDSYDYNLTRDKSAFGIGTMSFDDFEEFDDDIISDIADHLLENGVIVPPCKVGDTVWFNTFKKNATVCVGIQPHTVDRIDVICVCDTKNLVETNIRDWEFGKTVFLTKEEAEKALKEGADNA